MPAPEAWKGEKFTQRCISAMGRDQHMFRVSLQGVAMLRKLVCAVAILGLSAGLAVAEEMRGKITKIDDGKVTFQVYDKETKKFGDAKTYEVAKDVKVNKMDNDKKILVDGGLKSPDLSKIDAEMGLRATINVTDGRVTEITLSAKKRKDSN
jgi:hypothetical protein